jgi:hypothetical protein
VDLDGAEELAGAGVFPADGELAAPLPVALAGSAAAELFVRGVPLVSCAAPHAVASVTARDSARALTAAERFGRHDPGIDGSS